MAAQGAEKRALFSAAEGFYHTAKLDRVRRAALAVAAVVAGFGLIAANGQHPQLAVSAAARRVAVSVVVASRP